MFRRFVAKCFLLVFLSMLFSLNVLALKQLVSLQGKITLNGALVDDGNLSVTLWDSATDGNLIYNSSEYFNNSIQSGFFDVMLGSNKDLDINLSGTYYLDFQVNDVDLDKGGDERIQFQSPVGFKLSGLENFSVDTDVLFVDTENDRVGIGNSAPTTALDVTGTVTATSFAGDGSSLTGITTTTSVWNSSTTNVYLNDSTVKIGIGTATPNQDLVVIGNSNITNISVGSVLEFTATDSPKNDTTNGARIYYNSSDKKLKVSEDGGAYQNLASYIVIYNASLENVTNTMVNSTIISFTVPANSWKIGDYITIVWAAIKRNNEGSTRAIAMYLQVGDGQRNKFSNITWGDSNDDKKMFEVAQLMRIDDDVWIQDTDFTAISSNAVSSRVLGNSSPSNFNQDLIVNISGKWNRAHAELYIKPLFARVEHHTR